MKPRDSCEPMYSALGIMIFSDVSVYLISKFMFRFCKGDVPEIFRAYFRFNSEIHNYFTRQCDYLHVPIVKKQPCKIEHTLQGCYHMELHNF